MVSGEGWRSQLETTGTDRHQGEKSLCRSHSVSTQITRFELTTTSERRSFWPRMQIFSNFDPCSSFLVLKSSSHRRSRKPCRRIALQLSPESDDASNSVQCGINVDRQSYFASSRVRKAVPEFTDVIDKKPLTMAATWGVLLLEKAW